MELKITMIPALEDPDQESPAYQEELAEFEKSLKKARVECEAKPGKLLLTDTSHFVYAGTFVVKLAEAHGTTVVAAIAAYFHGRHSRKVRLKVGDIEAEAQSVGDVEKLIDKAQEIRKHNEPKVIHEP